MDFQGMRRVFFILGEFIQAATSALPEYVVCLKNGILFICVLTKVIIT